MGDEKFVWAIWFFQALGVVVFNAVVDNVIYGFLVMACGT